MKKIQKLIPVVLVACASVYPFVNQDNIKFQDEIVAQTVTKNEIKDSTLAKVTLEKNKSAFETLIESTYNSLVLENESFPSYKSFSKAFSAYYQLEQEGLIKNDILTVIDFSLSSTQKRLWVIDMEQNKVILHSLVAHGRNSGEEFATSFSNKLNSYQSSLGAYLTGETYTGKHGFSMRLDGMDQDLNAMARERAVVVHAADYVSASFVNEQGRLGRSQGCPAVPAEINKKLINLIKDQSVMYIYHSNLDKLEDAFKTPLFS
nr:murein L,D-transpeptidase catalytic domain family protein [uncultured Flavobacterium sp.]